MKIGVFTLFLCLLALSNAAYDGFLEDLFKGSWRVLEALKDDLITTPTPRGPDSYKTDAEYYQSYGYRFEEHKIMTDDGYILSAWRIPGKITESMKNIQSKPAVMLQHGLLDNSATWTINEFKKSLPFKLLQEGYDVWITNSRGNFNSYEHINPQEFSVFDMGSKYWNFSLDEMGIYDVPANLNYILDYTSQEKLTYIGHSQGTIQFFIANSMLDIADKIKLFVGVGPVMFVNHQRSPLATIASFLKIFDILDTLGLNNILIWPKLLNVELPVIVNRFRRTLWRFIQLIVGVEEDMMIDTDRMLVLARHEPGGTSVQNMEHWLQMMSSGKFQRMDYGPKKNMKVYGQKTPPEFNLKKLVRNLKDINMFLIRGDKDAFVDEDDFGHLLQVFGDKLNDATLEHIVVPKYGHLDYIWAETADKEINEPIMDFLKRNS
jgi:pimeloyl-ACP methyl ester carboxylesterase